MKMSDNFILFITSIIITEKIYDIGAFSKFIVTFTIILMVSKIIGNIIITILGKDVNENGNFLKIIRNYTFISHKSNILLIYNFILSLIGSIIATKIYGIIGSFIGFIILFITLLKMEVRLIAKHYNINSRLFYLCMGVKLWFSST